MEISCYGLGDGIQTFASSYLAATSGYKTQCPWLALGLCGSLSPGGSGGFYEEAGSPCPSARWWRVLHWFKQGTPCFKPRGGWWTFYLGHKKPTELEFSETQLRTPAREGAQVFGWWQQWCSKMSHRLEWGSVEGWNRLASGWQPIPEKCIWIYTSFNPYKIWSFS